MPPFVLTTLSYPCPRCGEACVQEVDTEGKPVGAPTVDGCASIACENAFANGEHADALRAAWDEYCEAAFERQSNRYDGGSGGDANLLHIQREAQRLK